MELTYFVERQSYLKQEIARLEGELLKYPPGELSIYEFDGYIKWRMTDLNDPDAPKYLSKKKDRKKAVIMAQKKLLDMKCKDMKNELECIDRYLKYRKECGWKELYAPGSNYRELLVKPDDWEYSDYARKPDPYDNRKHQAPKGELVRSKSEAMIASCLYENGIPYHYEEYHEFNGAPIAPDFTIRHPVTGKTYIWEHFGLAEKKNYQGTITYKLPIYLDAGFVPGINFIQTYETEAYPLSIEKVKQIVAEYFL